MFSLTFVLEKYSIFPDLILKYIVFSLTLVKLNIMTVRLARWPVFSEVEIPGFFQVFGNILVIFHGFPKMFPGSIGYSLDNNTTRWGQNSTKNRLFSICVYFSHFGKPLLKIIKMVGDNSENFLLEVPKMHIKSSTMVGENLKNYLYGMAKKDLNSSTRNY